MIFHKQSISAYTFCLTAQLMEHDPRWANDSCVAGRWTRWPGWFLPNLQFHDSMISQVLPMQETYRFLPQTEPGNLGTWELQFTQEGQSLALLIRMPMALNKLYHKYLKVTLHFYGPSQVLRSAKGPLLAILPPTKCLMKGFSLWQPLKCGIPSCTGMHPVPSFHSFCLCWRHTTLPWPLTVS